MNSVITPYVRQLLVASSCQLAAISAGGLAAYPAVLINQLKGANSTIPLDLDSTSWIASIEGFAGILSVIVPALMQWRGRRFAFITTCLCIISGWILIYFAQDVKTILIGELFHGFGLNSAVVISLSTISEMVDPKYRNMSMILFQILHLVGIIAVTFLGYFLNWRVVCILMTVPVVLSLCSVIFWPESPSWLACKGKFDKCAEAFTLIRGTGEDAMNELKELLRAQKESARQSSLRKSLRISMVREFWIKITNRDFYLPILHMLLLFLTFYWSGPIVIFMYAVQIIETTTKVSDFVCYIYSDIVVIISCFICIICTKYLKNKTVILFSTIGCILCLILSSIVIYVKDYKIFPKETLLFCVLGFVLSCSIGNSNQIFVVSTELIPVKHRGLGGSLFLIFTCLLHSVTVKTAPYLFLLIGISGTFIFYAFIAIVGIVLIMIYIPETKGKTLQDIENYYNGGILVVKDEDCDADIVMPLKNSV